MNTTTLGSSAPEFAAAKEQGGECYYEHTVDRGDPKAALRGDISVDVGIVGAGFAGLSAALELSKRGFSVAVLEAERIAQAASGRNGGQILPGYSCDIEVIARALGRPAARRAWDLSVEGMDIMQQHASAPGVNCDYTTGWMLLAARPGHVSKLKAWHRSLTTEYGYGDHIQFVEASELAAWTSGRGYHAALVDHRAASVNPLKLALVMAAECIDSGVQLFETTSVLQVVPGPAPRLETAHGNVLCKNIVLAANVFIGGLNIPIQNRIMSVGNTMIATEPVQKGIIEQMLHQRYAGCDTNFLLDYYRVTCDDRMLWGGGSTYLRHDPKSRIETLRRKMVRVFPELESTRVAFAWGGLIDATLSRAPDFGRLDGTIYYLQGFSGHGLNVTAIAGRLVAEAIEGKPERFDLLARLRHRNFPGGQWLRRSGLALGAAYYQMRDWLA